MNNFSRYMLSRRMMRDGRNPYGSRGGYVTSRAPRRDRAMEMPRYRDYAEANGYKPVESMGYFTSYYDEEDGRGRMDYNDERPTRVEDYDYEPMYDGAYKLSNKDIKKWEKNLENADGTKGKKYDVEQVRQVAQQHGIRFDEYSPELLTAITNMMYSDYCKVLGGDMMIYVKLAKAFLEDDDFDGEPEEKAMLYYKCIVSKDD